MTAEGATPEKQYLLDRYSERIDLGTCLVGKVLDVYVLRGYSDIGRLAAVSAADYFYQESDDNGIQRPLVPKHAREAYAYMSTPRPGVDGLMLPRMVPEILLNVRDLSVVEFYDPSDPEREIEFSSTEFDALAGPHLVGVRVRTSLLSFPKPSSADPGVTPQISRVDGNHRLWGADEQIHTDMEDGVDGEDLPPIGYCLLVGLEPMQEASVFVDINGTPLKVATGHIQRHIAQTLQAQDWATVRERLKKDRTLLANWLAYQLAQDGHAFADMVDFGGYGAIDTSGRKLPLKFPMITSAVVQTLGSAEVMTQTLADRPEGILAVLDNFWRAAWAQLPEAKANKKDFILLQTIGLNALAKLGGWLIDNRTCVRQDQFEVHLKLLRADFSFSKGDHLGLAGAAGTRIVYEEMLRVVTEGKEKAMWDGIMQDLLPDESVDEKLEKGLE